MTTTTPNFDYLAERIRERLTAPSGWGSRFCTDIGNGSGCGAMLTETDTDLGYCSQCGNEVSDDVDDESADEHLWEGE